MSTFLELQDEVLNHGFDQTAYRSRVKNWLNEAAHRVARSLELRDVKASYDLATVVGGLSYTLPADFVRMESVTDTTSWDSLDLTPQADIDNITVTGTPEYYAFGKDNTIVLWPISDHIQTIRLLYYKNPAALSADTDVSPLPADYHDLLVSYACSRAFRAEDDYESSQFFMAEFQRDLAQLGTDRQYESGDVTVIAGCWPTQDGWWMP